jgi:hypothetical protein
MNQTITEPVDDPAECHNCWEIEDDPLLEATMTVKTVEFSGNAVTDFTTLKEKLDRAPGDGYCEIMVWDMTAVSNVLICSAVTNAANTNVGFYARITFPTCFN